MAEICFVLNGKKTKVRGHSFSRLLDILRETDGLTGTKEGCGEGECGACSVLMDGKLVNSCLIPLAQAERTHITTIEGIKRFHPLQKAFIDFGGAQCGICTPGMIMASYFLLSHNRRPSEEEIRIGLSGNLCRCTGFIKIFEAVNAASKKIIQGRKAK